MIYSLGSFTSEVLSARRRMLGVLLTSCIAVLLPVAAASAPRPAVKTFLQQKAGFSSNQIAALDGGQVVTKILPTSDKSEVAVLGVVRVNAPRAVFLDRAKDVRKFQTVGVSDLVILSAPPQLSDFNRFTVPSDDLKELQNCKPGNCKVKLPLKRMNEFRQQVNWNSSDSAGQANQMARQALLNGILAYQKSGSAAFDPMVDKDNPVSLATEFHALLSDSPYLLAFYPDFYGYLDSYPQGNLQGATNIFYWANEDFGLKPTFTVNQAVIYAPAGSPDAVIGWKQIYASHYFYGSLATTIYVADPGANYLVQLERSRLDGFSGRMGGIYRGKVEKGLNQKVSQFLTGAKQQL